MRLFFRSLVAFVVLIPFTHGPAMAAGPIASGDTQAGVITSPTYSESWTFTATAGDRIVISAVTISGSLNTNVTLYPPVGPAEYNTANDRFDIAVAHTGTYTLEVTDVGLNDPGLYVLGLMNVTAGPFTSGSDLDGGVIASTGTATGTIAGTSDLDAFQFTGTSGDRIVLSCIATGGAGFNTYFTIYPPGGGTAIQSNFGDQGDVQLNATGTWTLVVEDAGNDTAGSYAICLMNITAGPLTSIADPDGGPIVSGSIYSGQFNQSYEFDAWTFSGSAGDRIIVVDPITGGGTHNTTVYVFPPGGLPYGISNSNDRFDFQLTQSGTHTIVIYDAGLDNTGSYALAILNVTAGPHTSGGDLDGSAIVSSDVTGGTTGAVGDMDAFTFTANSGERVMIDCLATAGAGYNTYFTLYPPAGGPPLVSSFGDAFDTQLNATGTWTIVVEDAGDDTPGTYALSLLNITSGPYTNGGDVDGSPIVSGQIYSGAFNQGVDMDAWTFTATAGDRVVLVGMPNPPGLHNTTMVLFPPGGGPNTFNTASDRFEQQLPQTGTYTLVLYDVGYDNTGAYTLALMNITSGPHTAGGDADGAPIASSQVTGGTTNTIGDMDVFTFTGTSGDRVLIDCVATAGAGYNTMLYLYPPGGGGAIQSSFGDLIDVQLNATGTWSFLVEDAGNDTGGAYSMSLLNVTAGPYTDGGDGDGGAILSNQVKSGQFHYGVDMDAYQFTGAVDERILIAGVATLAGTHNTQLYLYPPGGGPAVVTGASDRVDYKLTASGTYTVVVTDVGFDNLGTYALSYLNVTSGPFADGGDPNGGAIASNQVRTGINTTADFDAYTFTGTSGHRLLMSAVATGGGGNNTMIRLYPPNGGAVASSTFGDRLEYKLTATGTWTVLIEDDGNDTSGNYSVSVLDATGGPYTGFGEADGGPILVGPPLAGSSYAVSDFDGFTFTGYNGQNAALSATVTSGAMNTYLSLYPPDGGAPLTQTANDNVNVALTMDGVYTVVVEDLGQDQTGTYGVSVNLSNGPTPVRDTPPAVVALLPAYPSPFSASTSLDFTLPSPSRVQLRIYDVRGALVRDLVSDERGAGVHRVSWDGRDTRGARVASGVYYAQFQAAGKVQRQKLVLVR